VCFLIVNDFETVPTQYLPDRSPTNIPCDHCFQSNVRIGTDSPKKEGMMPRRILIHGFITSVGLFGFAGCAGHQYVSQNPFAPVPAVTAKFDAQVALPATKVASISRKLTEQGSVTEPSATTEIVPANHSNQSETVGLLTVAQADEITPPAVDPFEETPSADFVSDGAVITTENAVHLNLPTALAMVGGDHPAVGFAQWRVQEAYAQLAQAEVLWLPSIQAGFSVHRHDGNYQASDGTIVDVNRNSFQYGLGAGANGAGTTPRPGLVAQFHLADAIFQPEIAQKTAWARGHAANAVLNEQLYTVASAYMELVNAHQDARIFEETQSRITELTKITRDFAEAGEGLKADADRMQTESILAENSMVGSRERIAISSARLARAISMDGACEISPMELTAIPIELVPIDVDKGALISSGLATRPELKESQALVAAACEAYRREKYSPFVPSVLLGFSTSEFGGGLGNGANNFDNRYDFDAMVTWEIRNLGFGERNARDLTSARIQQAKYQKLRVMDDIAMEISEAYSQAQFRREQMHITQGAIQSAEDSYKLNLSRIRDGQGLPLEVLQSVQALESARRAYLQSVIDYNQAQFRLQWALGWPVSTPIQQPADQ